jgi:hypothetical protein
MKQAGQVATVNVNTATRPSSRRSPRLPYADKIIKGRPCKSVDQLADKNIVPKDARGHQVPAHVSSYDPSSKADIFSRSLFRNPAGDSACNCS